LFRVITQTGCEKTIDVGVILDASNDIPKQLYTSLKTFVTQFVANFVVSSIGSHFGFVSFDDEVRVDLKFSDSMFYNPDKLQEKIKGLRKMGSGSRIDLAIDKANEELFSVSGGNRIKLPKTLIVFTEDMTNSASKPYSDVIAPLIVS
jgi:hypothetical protein